MDRPRILVSSSLYPLPIDRGDKNRLYHILGLLSDIGDVRLVCLRRDWEIDTATADEIPNIEVRSTRIAKREILSESLKALVSLRPFVAFRFGSPRILPWMKQQIADFNPDIVWGFQISSMPFLCDKMKARKVLDLVDSPSRYFAESGRNKALSLSARLVGKVQWRMAEYERRALALSDTVLVNSRQEQVHLRRMHGAVADKVLQLDNCVPRQLLSLEWSAAQPHPSILFVGNMSYPPNISAITEFIANVLPKVRLRVPDAEFVVCGAGSKELACHFERIQNLRFIGYVDDLAGVYLNSSVKVVPVPVAGGTQYKLLEALAVGLPVVASPASAETGAMIHGEQLLVGADATSFADAVVRLLQDQAFAMELSGRGKDFIRKHHTWEGKTDVVRSVVYSLKKQQGKGSQTS